MLSFLGALPLIGSIVTSLTTSLFDARVKITQAKIGGDRDVAVELVQAAAKAEANRSSNLATFAGSKALMTLLFMFATPIAIFMWKVIIWDNVLGDITGGNTDPIRGQVGEWANVIIACIFGSSTAVTIGHMWFNRKTS